MNYFNPQPKTYSAKKVKRVKTKRRKKTGEGKMFLTIWEERPHYCSNLNCKKYLGEEPRAQYFAHIRSKGAHSELRFNKDNVVIMCFDCHFIYDNGDRNKIILS